LTEVTTEKYRQRAASAAADPILQRALAGIQERLGKGAATAYRNLPEGPDLRLKAHEMRKEAIANLDLLLERLANNVRENGGQVFFAETDRDAVEYCIGVARENKVRLAVKGKSMVTEEIGLNPALEAAGVEVVETDLGEYIVQLAAEHPSHIIAPAIHKTRQQIGRLFENKLGIPYLEDPPKLTMAARKSLRQKFLSADMGISGCNIACAQTGHITTVSNEGNIRMCSTLPRVHVAFMGMERVTDRLSDHDILFRLLARAAAAQNMATYVSYIGGPRRPGQSDGPEAFHLVILDNGRTRILADDRYREMLCCIRCAACLNVCPVYRKIGGHAYGYPYSGPVGAVVTPLLVGVNRAKDLCLGETLCGACQDICPVNINIPRMLLELRAALADGDRQWAVRRASAAEKMMFKIWSWLIQNRQVYERFLRLSSMGLALLPRRDGFVRVLPPPFAGWTAGRNIKPPAARTFMSQWKKMQENRP
jgi:L-lactate dehydrogenase complex protein LldF